MTTGRQPTPGQPSTTPGEPVEQAPTRHRRRGRRTGGSDTRAEILAAARHEFATLGYPGASMRTIAARAEVDPHLIVHYFGSKQGLFVAIAELLLEPETVLDQLYAAGLPGLARRLAELVASCATGQVSQETVTALVRAAASEEQAAALVRDIVNERLLLPLIVRLGSDQPDLRACLIASQIVGMTTATHIIRLEPLTDAPAELLATALTPVFEHYLSGTLSIA